MGEMPAAARLDVASPSGMAPLRIEADVPLAPLSTLAVGGHARYFARAATREHVCLAVRWAREHDLPLLPLGDGSNVVFGDGELAAVVLKLELAGMEWVQEGQRAVVSVAAGERWDDVVAEAVARAYAGIECLSGIPGRAGAAPIQNIGAYGQDLAARVLRVHTLDPETGSDITLDRGACGLGYRTSAFKTDAAARRLIVLGVTLELDVDGSPSVEYEALAQLLEQRGAGTATLAEVRAAVLDLRRQKSMLSDPEDAWSRSVGSFFVNPILTPAEHAAAQARGRRSRALSYAEEMRTIVLADGRRKVPAAWLIERSGFARGYRRGAVGLSPKHALALVNCGGATARQVLDLAREIMAAVADRFAIRLVPEPVLVNCSLD
jgi:UDP-N-acetylmuramate dehydrogenase